MKCWCGQVNTDYREIKSLRPDADQTHLREYTGKLVESFRQFLHMIRIFLAAPDIDLDEIDVRQTDSIQKSYFYIYLYFHFSKTLSDSSSAKWDAWSTKTISE